MKWIKKIKKEEIEKEFSIWEKSSTSEDEAEWLTQFLKTKYFKNKEYLTQVSLAITLLLFLTTLTVNALLLNLESRIIVLTELLLILLGFWGLAILAKYEEHAKKKHLTKLSPGMALIRAMKRTSINCDSISRGLSYLMIVTIVVLFSSLIFWIIQHLMGIFILLGGIFIIGAISWILYYYRKKIRNMKTSSEEIKKLLEFKVQENPYLYLTSRRALLRDIARRLIDERNRE